MRKIAFSDAKYRALRESDQLQKMFREVLHSGIFHGGRNNTLLVTRLTSSTNAKYVSLTASGHDSLYLALHALKLQATDEVIVPANAYPSAFPVVQYGAKLVFADVNDQGLLDLKRIESYITPRTRAIIPVHLFGHTVPIDELSFILHKISKSKIYIIEDCAQALGATIGGKMVGSLGDIGCFSFYPTKNCGTLGDGGAIVTNTLRYYKHLQKATSYGEKKRYDSAFISGHSRIPEIQAGAVAVYLKRLRQDIQLKQKLAATYDEYLAPLHPNVIPIAHTRPNESPGIHLYVIRAKRRNALQKYLQSNGIPTFIHYPTPTHMVKAFNHLNYDKNSFPTAAQLSREILSLPIGIHLDAEAIQYISRTIARFYE